MNGDKANGPPRAKANVEQTWWPGWIWSVPIAALLVVGWLAVRAATTRGTDITIIFDDVHGLSQDDDVVYRGTRIGHVTHVELNEDGKAVKVSANIKDRASRFLKSGTRFWLEGAHPSISNLSSLSAIFGGPKIAMEPGPGEKITSFRGLDRKPIRPIGSADGQRFRVVFGRAGVGGLRRGDPVKLRGVTVGQIEEVEFHVDATTGEIATPVILELFASLLHIEDLPKAEGTEPLRDVMTTLIQKGLHAQLERDPPLVGGYAVTLELVPEAGEENPRVVDGTPEIPTLEGRGINSFVARLNEMPIDRIADNVLAITQHVNSIVAAPELADAAAQVDAALKQIRQTVAAVGPKIRQVVEKLRLTADQLDRTAQSIDKVAGGPASQMGVANLVQEATQAARALRELADYLDRHPEALIRGRSGE